jgi:ankyrin repeat protein
VTDIEIVLKEIEAHTCYLDDQFNEVALVDVNQKDWTGDSPLHIATRLGLTAAIRILADHGANINAVGERGLTALHYAAFKNNVEAVVELLACGANPNIKDEDGARPRDWAISAGNEEVIKLLE